MAAGLHAERKFGDAGLWFATVFLVCNLVDSDAVPGSMGCTVCVSDRVRLIFELFRAKYR
jgi:hypothetical protein